MQSLAFTAETSAQLFVDQGLAFFFFFFFPAKGRRVNVLGVRGLVVSVAAAQHCHGSTKAVRDKVTRTGIPVFQ